MKELIVLSGKGGTGKTTIVGSFAALAKNKVLTDCDVDAADLHLLLQPEAISTNEFWGGRTAHIDRKRCTECGLCIDICRYGAISDDYEVNPISCEGCGFCYNICPVDAIEMRENMAGYWFVSDTKYGPLVHAKLGIAQENSGKLVATVRQNARALAKEKNIDLIISDGPPGIGCPVISSLSGSNLALLVTEPTLSGIHDLERVIGTCQHFGVPAVVCINKYDINEENSRAIEGNCKRMNAEVISKIPFDNVVTEALVHGVPVVEYSCGQVSKEIAKLWTLADKMLQPSKEE
jgi:MinD superfamily P-loop ATPase